MRVLVISDIHANYVALEAVLADAHGRYDIIWNLGDTIGYGPRPNECMDRMLALNTIMIAGNHDFLFENSPEVAKDILDRIGPGIIYLNDSGVELEGLKFWGSPVTPWFHNWAFNRVGEKINEHWDLIPTDVNILITHGPPYLTLDATKSGLRVGCPELANKIKDLSDLKVHVFGHIHEAEGIVEKNGVIYVNATILDLYYEVKNSPVILHV